MFFETGCFWMVWYMVHPIDPKPWTPLSVNWVSCCMLCRVGFHTCGSGIPSVPKEWSRLRLCRQEMQTHTRIAVYYCENESGPILEGWQVNLPPRDSRKCPCCRLIVSICCWKFGRSGAAIARSWEFMLLDACVTSISASMAAPFRGQPRQFWPHQLTKSVAYSEPLPR